MSEETKAELAQLRAALLELDAAVRASWASLLPKPNPPTEPIKGDGEDG